MESQKQKNILVGVSGGIAAYKSVQLVSDLVKLGYDVEVVMTNNATQFIQPLTFETLIKHKVIVDTFDRSFEYSTKHISLAKKADVILIAPATANVIAKIANGIADDMLTTTILAAECPKIIAPAMNTVMYHNPATQENFERCKRHGILFVEPEDGLLACGDVGKGKLAGIPHLIEAVQTALVYDKPLKGQKVVITAGPTIEYIDPVRYITNHSSGKMGYALARAARNMGANVVLISGPVTLPYPTDMQVIPVQTASQMFDAVVAQYQDADMIVKAAAVSDYRIAEPSAEKIKKLTEETTLTLVRNPDILAYLGEHISSTQVLCGFAMETQDLIANASAKRSKKKADMIVANDLKQPGAGFAHDTNITTLITNNDVKSLPLMSKEDLAYEIFWELLNIQTQKRGK